MAREGNRVDGKLLCGCIEDGRPCAKASGLDMTGWACESDTGLRQEYPEVKPAEPVKSEVELLREELAEYKEAFNQFAILVMALSIEGLADAAIIAHQPMSERHSIAALKQLVKYAKELRLEKSIRDKMDKEGITHQDIADTMPPRP